MATEKKHALYLVNSDEDRIELVHAEDVDDRKANGWKEPEGMKANGQPWNAERDLPGQDIAADIAKQTAAADAKEQKSAKAEEAPKVDVGKPVAKK
jgi:hypothetical protein